MTLWQPGVTKRGLASSPGLSWVPTADERDSKNGPQSTEEASNKIISRTADDLEDSWFRTKPLHRAVSSSLTVVLGSGVSAVVAPL